MWEQNRVREKRCPATGFEGRGKGQKPSNTNSHGKQDKKTDCSLEP